MPKTSQANETDQVASGDATDADALAAAGASQAASQADSQANAGTDDADIGAGTQQITPPSWRDQAKNAGFDLSKYEKDDDAWKYLAERNTAAEQAEAARLEAHQAAEMANVGRQFLPYASEFQQFLASKNPKQAEVDPYARPEYDSRWLSMVKRSENGEIVPDAANGGTPEIVSKLLRHTDWQRGFLTEPEKYLEKTIDSRAQAIAEKLLASRTQQIQEDFAAKQFILQNRDWLYAKDAGGAFTNDLSEEGKWFQGDLDEASRLGFTAAQQEAYAMRMLSMRRQVQAAGAKPTADDKKKKFLTDAAAQGAQSGASAHTPLSKNDPPQNRNHTLAEMLAADLKAANIDDSVFANV